MSTTAGSVRDTTRTAVEIARDLATGCVTVNGETGIIARVLVKITDSSINFPECCCRESSAYFSR